MFLWLNWLTNKDRRIEMKEYEIHIGASYTTSGGSEEWTYITEYVMADSVEDAEQIKLDELRNSGYSNITMDIIEA